MKKNIIEFHVRDYYKLKAGSSLFDTCTMSQKFKENDWEWSFGHIGRVKASGDYVRIT